MSPGGNTLATVNSVAGLRPVRLNRDDFAPRLLTGMATERILPGFH